MLITNDITRLTLDRDPKNRGINVTMDVFGADEKIVVGIEKNEFTVNPNNYYRMKRPDKSTLVVLDQYKKEVLNIRYLNRRAIKLSALLYYPGVQGPIEIDDDGIKVETGLVSDSCSLGLAKGYGVIGIHAYARQAAVKIH